ncbi:hypothetical protein [Acidovorax delafieldii]|uniref:hypothetical protein n=1 Tax=Acidovorax delafieldii TaxID=47920 RepID=UPI003ECC675F
MSRPIPPTPLRIGFASVYAWRPHVEHLQYLATLARKDGHSCAFLTCDADLPHCYTRELRDVRPDWQECLICRTGGLRSYAPTGVSSIGELQEPALSLPARAKDWALSSAGTLGRFESDSDFASPAFHEISRRLDLSVELAYRATRNWIANEKLDAVCVFNARMDATRAIFEAARDSGIRVVSVERTWFGDGLQLLPEENCLGLHAVDTLVDCWSHFPLTKTQAHQAAGYVAARLTGRNQTEWRAYNADAEHTGWPSTGAMRRVLLLPGSRNEIWGHPDWQSDWKDPLAAYDAVMEHFGLKAADVVLRCHPNWGERIGKADGRLAESYYTEWAQTRGIHVIPSADKASTMGLIGQSDAVVLASGSAAFEAGVLGKQVIATAPSMYQRAGQRTDATTPQALEQATLHANLDPATQAKLSQDISRKSLRFGYTMARRVAQYAGFVRAESSSRYRYVAGADPARLTRLLLSGQLETDDATFAADEGAENEVLDTIARRDWEALTPIPPSTQREPVQAVRRRWMFRPIDTIRGWMPVGDR